MKIRRFGAKKKARIEIIPMIDTMFFLLVFFMVATMSMTVMRGMPVNLPKVDSADSRSVPENRSVTISSDGSLYLDKEAIRIEELGGSLRAYAAADQDALVIINADESVIHGKVVEVMDTVKLSGIKRLAIATRPK
ncbi:MAG: hypothetical protein A2054_05120 [Deltaproteobacteria bacterium GWA2_55_10]|nr:MAG: hypothetical protein A2054_05120 [Deltaproteobacteria bacterium GWA2_55_10]